MSIPDELRNIRDHLRSGRFGQREVWERQLENAADDIERLKELRTLSQNNGAAWDMILREREELRAENEQLRALLTDTVMSMERGGFYIDLQKRIRVTLEPKP